MRENEIHSAGYIYLRPKVTLHCLFIYFFRIFVSVYEKCLIPGKARSVTHKTGDFLGFWYHKCNRKTVMKHARGKNKLFSKCIAFDVFL